MTRTARVIITCARLDSNSVLRSFVRALMAAALATLITVVAGGIDGDSATFDQATLAASKSLEAKLQILGATDAPPTATYPAVVITVYEANSYLKVHSGEFLPPGVHTPALGVQPEQAMASADVDFDELSRSYPNPNDMGPKILAAMFHGTQHVTVTAKIQSGDTGVLVQIESVEVGSMNVPNWLIDLVIQNFLQPRYKFDLSKPLPYPDHVKKIVLGSGQVTFLRGPKTGK